MQSSPAGKKPLVVTEPEPTGGVDDLPVVRDPEELVELLGSWPDAFVRWSRGPQWDSDNSSCDELTGVALPGLSANALRVEEWWGERPLQLWVARRLYDYRHLREQRGPGVRPWVLTGTEVGRGPDNEPLVRCEQPLAWVDEKVVTEATRLVDDQQGEWGPMDRR